MQYAKSQTTGLVEFSSREQTENSEVTALGL